MSDRAVGAEYRTTMVCIDSYENRVPTGRLYNPFHKDGRTFQSMMQFLVEMEGLLTAMDFPKAFTAARTFAAPAAHNTGPPQSQTPTGKTATFAVKVLFRQNASWQGSVTWMEGRREESFRSVLELLTLIDSAVQAEEKAS